MSPGNRTVNRVSPIQVFISSIRWSISRRRAAVTRSK
jgi:hypothetical protein